MGESKGYLSLAEQPPNHLEYWIESDFLVVVQHRHS